MKTTSDWHQKSTSSWAPATRQKKHQATLEHQTCPMHLPEELATLVFLIWSNSFGNCPWPASPQQYLKMTPDIQQKNLLWLFLSLLAEVLLTPTVTTKTNHVQHAPEYTMVVSSINSTNDIALTNSHGHNFPSWSWAPPRRTAVHADKRWHLPPSPEPIFTQSPITQSNLEHNLTVPVSSEHYIFHQLQHITHIIITLLTNILQH